MSTFELHRRPIEEVAGVLSMEIVELRKRRDDLLRSNNEFEERAQKAEAALASAWMDCILQIAEKLIAAAAVHSQPAADNVAAMIEQIKTETP